MSELGNVEIREEIGTSPEPKWWPHKSEYWSTFGSYPDPPKRGWWQRSKPEPEKKPAWSILFYTKEDAEAYTASIGGKGANGWVWDGNPAGLRPLKVAMRKARLDGDMGVQVMSYVNGKWVSVKEYPAGVPLPDEEVE